MANVRGDVIEGNTRVAQFSDNGTSTNVSSQMSRVDSQRSRFPSHQRIDLLPQTKRSILSGKHQRHDRATVLVGPPRRPRNRSLTYLFCVTLTEKVNRSRTETMHTFRAHGLGRLQAPAFRPWPR